MTQMFFDGWTGLVRTLIVGVLAYVTLVVFLRLFGKRSLSKMNAFDFVVTVALGSTLATVLLDSNIALAEGALAFAVLLALQFVVTWCSVRARWVRQVVTGEPRLLLYRGKFLEEALRSSRVTQDEVRAAIRQAGHASLEKIEAVALETDGSLSVVAPRLEAGPGSALIGLRSVGQSRADSGSGAANSRSARS
jgi:uncharacterized membrane protein YcaP (DUF421 family)